MGTWNVGTREIVVGWVRRPRVVILDQVRDGALTLLPGTLEAGTFSVGNAPYSDQVLSLYLKLGHMPHLQHFLF